MLLAIFQYTSLTCSLSLMPINLWDKNFFFLVSYSQSILNVTDPHFPQWFTANPLHKAAVNQWQKNLVCNSQYIPWTQLVHNTAEPQFIVKTTPGELAITLSDNILFGQKRSEHLAVAFGVHLLHLFQVFVCGKNVIFQTVSPLQQYVLLVPIYTPGWRETRWSRVPCLRKQGDRWGLNPRPPDPEFEVLTTLPYSLHLTAIKRQGLITN